MLFFGAGGAQVLAKKSILPHAACARVETENTGFTGLRNKGGITARFDYMSSPICFISSHLAAHEVSGAESGPPCPLLCLFPHPPSSARIHAAVSSLPAAAGCGQFRPQPWQLDICWPRAQTVHYRPGWSGPWQ